MTDENGVQESVPMEPVQETLPVSVEVQAAPATAPTGKKRGRKPKPPAAPPPPEPAKPVVKKRKKANVVRLSAADRAFQSAIQKTEDDRSKVIEEMSKIMEMWDVKQARLKALDWKLSTLRGTTQTSAIASMQLTPYGQPQQPAYVQNGGQSPQTMHQPQMPFVPSYPAAPAPAYVPPAMRQAAAMPIEPRATGGSEGVIDDGDNEDPDKFLKGDGVIGGSRGWIG